jgi:hypothetical protein
MLGGVKRECLGVCGINGVADEAASGMSVEADHEEEGQMMGVPKRLKALVSHLGLSGGIH